MAAVATAPLPPPPLVLHTPDAVEESDQYPPRFWWLKRLTLAGLLLLAALVGLRAWWGWEAQRRLRRETDQILAAGYPLRVTDMFPRPLPDGENAGWYLRKAADALPANRVNESPSNSPLTFPTYPPFGPLWEAMEQKSLTASARAFPLARHARGRKEFEWGTRPARPSFDILLPHINDARTLAHTLCDAALYAHLRGDDEAALELVRDVRHQSRGAMAEPFLVCYLVGTGIEALAQERLRVIAAGLTIAPYDSAPVSAGGAPPLPALDPPRRPATRSQVRALVAEVLDERPAAEALVRSVAGERAMLLDAAEWAGQGTRLLRPMYRLDAVRMARHTAVWAEAASRPTLPAARAVFSRPANPKPPPPSKVSFPFTARRPAPAKRGPIDFTTVVSGNLLSATPARPVEMSMRARAERRMGAVNLAAQLYRADHGRWPPALEALVPTYLPAVPRDPLAEGDRPLGYVLIKGGLPGGGERPLVYSVGLDAVDDTAAGTAAPPAAPCIGWNVGRDEWRDIAPWPATQGAP